MLIQIYKGERAHTKDNPLFERFLLSNISPAPPSVSQIDVVFDIYVSNSVSISH